MTQVTDTPLIHRVVNADRGLVFVSTEEVHKAIRALDSEAFTTRDLADELIGKHLELEYPRLEYAVRASISWLVNRGCVRGTERTIRRYTPAKEPYGATVYERIEWGGECDCELVNRIFLRV